MVESFGREGLWALVESFGREGPWALVESFARLLSYKDELESFLNLRTSESGITVKLVFRGFFWPKPLRDEARRGRNGRRKPSPTRSTQCQKL